ncbi:MAG: hypothetical protein U0R28_06350 [Candidatus Nanopelagicales bacterium]
MDEFVRTIDHGQVREYAKAWALQPRVQNGQLSLTDGEEIEWNLWFEQFEAQGLALLYEGTKEDGPRSVVYRLQPRAEAS